MLQTGWADSGGQCGKSFAVSMRTGLDGLERNGEFVDRRDRSSRQVPQELLSMSAATIHRYLAPARAKDRLRGESTTTPSPLLRLDHDPQGRRRGARAAGALRGRDRGALGPDRAGGVRVVRKYAFHFRYAYDAERAG